MPEGLAFEPASYMDSPTFRRCPAYVPFSQHSGDKASASLTPIPVTFLLAPAEIPQTFTYTILVQKTGAVTLHLEKLKDLLPEGLSYVMGSSSGITGGDPSVSNAGSRLELIWTFSPAEIQPGETKTQEFQATAAYLERGEYYNEVWATVSELGYEYYTWPISEIQAVGVSEPAPPTAKP